MTRKDETQPPSIANTISARDTSTLHGTIVSNQLATSSHWPLQSALLPIRWEEAINEQKNQQRFMENNESERVSRDEEEPVSLGP
jgi:hypothetical protein